MTKLDQLPSEILSLILTYVSNKDLPSCAPINKSFYRETMPLLCHTIDIHSRKKYTAFTTWLMQSPHGHHARSLTIRNMKAYTDVLEHVQDAPYLQLDSLQHIPHLTTLKISCGGTADPITSRTARTMIASAGHYCKQLTTLVLHNCVYSNYDDLFDALKDAPLTDIHLSLPRKLGPQVAQRFLKTAPLALHRYPLTRLWICVYDDTTSFINTINTHGLTWPHLTTFYLERCEFMTDAIALPFVQTHPTIERLELGGSKLTDAFLDGLVDYLPNLTMLNVDCNPAITAPGICRLIKNYDGRMYRVNCILCEIYPDDVPDDKTYHYEWACEIDENSPVECFYGKFEDKVGCS